MQKRITPEKYIVNPETGCWEWAERVNGDGYGYGFERGKQFYAHRRAYEELVGPIPANFDIDHLCRNRKCMNPEHLEPVTHAENIRRGLNAKCNAAAVEDIRARAAGGKSYGEIASAFGISVGTVCAIVIGRTWADAPGPIKVPAKRRHLTDQQVIEIRSRYANDLAVSVTQLANEYGVSRTTIIGIAVGRRRKRVPGPVCTLRQDRVEV